MRKIIFVFLFVLVFAGVTFAATYKIKTNSSGTIINNSVSKPYYNNYMAPQYVQNNIVNNTPATIVEIVMDFSGSMAGVVQVASNTMSSVVSQIPSSTYLGLRVFGQGSTNGTGLLAEVKSVEATVNEKGKSVFKLQTGKHSNSACKATKLVSPIASANANSLISGINSVELGGATPLVYALEQAAYYDLAKFPKEYSKKIILITDGGENCGGNPCSFAKQLMSKRNDIQIDVVFVSPISRYLSCLAKTTGGKTYNLSNIYQFSNVLTNSIKNQPQQTQSVSPIESTNQGYEFYNE